MNTPELFSLFALDMITLTAFGTSVNAVKCPNEYPKNVRVVAGSIGYRIRKPYLWNDWIYGLTPQCNFSFDQILKRINKRRKQRNHITNLWRSFMVLHNLSSNKREKNCKSKKKKEK